MRAARPLSRPEPGATQKSDTLRVLYRQPVRMMKSALGSPQRFAFWRFLAMFAIIDTILSSEMHPEDPSTSATMLTPAEIHARLAQVQHWYHQIPIADGIVTPGINDTAQVLRLLELPETLKGLRVLDIGARDGFFSFECERRGAEVVAIDCAPAETTGFNVVRDLFSSKLTCIRANVYEITPERFGKFDLILFLGVLYHLRDPLLAIDLIRSVCTDKLILETYVIDNAFVKADGSNVAVTAISSELQSVPIMQFYPRNTLNNDYTNYWGPNMKCVQAMLEEATFAVNKAILNGHRGLFMATTNEDSTLGYFARIARS